MLEVRGLGLVTGRNANDEIWRAIDAKANNHSTYMSQNPTDYPDNKDSRMTYLGVATGLAFQLAARHSVEYWPVPVFIWEPPKDPMPDSMVAVLVSRSDRVDRLIRGGKPNSPISGKRSATKARASSNPRRTSPCAGRPGR
ncbi:type VI lipase adapter Tla3 domain-containing protein [Burkholderia pseudomallei]|uniref:type VI lipase adapter Tla3 domain-containing protein n=1 Tax=Burkholderia pseudomallei TaxID=28450 RepID=UPI0024181C02|nr:DUF2875 family protein [Burkholderia pseudomallei]